MRDFTYSKFIEGHTEEPSVDFDYDEVDRGNPLAAELERSENPNDVSEGLNRILQWCWTGGDKLRNAKAWFARFVAFSMVTKPEMFGNASYEQVAKAMGLDKAWLSNLAVEFQDRFKVHFRRGRASESRVTFQRTAKRAHEKRKRLDAGKPHGGNLHRRFAEAYQRA